MTSLRNLPLLAAMLVAIPYFSRGDWKETTKIEGREHVSLDEVAASFGMERAKEARKNPLEIGFTGDAHQLAVKVNTREAIIDGARHWLSYPVQLSEGKPFVAAVDVRTTLKPAFDPTSVKLEPVKTVVFDPGHGGHDRGGRSIYGHEKDYTLDVVNRTRRILEERNIKVVQSRLSDFYATLHERPAMTKNYQSPIFVSVHFNSAGWRPSANGIEVYAIPPLGCPTTGKKPDPILDRRKSAGAAVESASFVLADTIHHTLLGRMDSFDRGVKRARYAVLRHCKVPAVLIEGGFLTNTVEARRIDTPEWREKFAEALADGIEAYIDLAASDESPPRVADFERSATDEFVTE